ncbi:hydrogenase maturation protein HypF [Crossiella equi]|uniref:Hydrogenase maturation protein HypF n=1 Tax=Crossiella equi TaxID=130796 RepID=A0ABS5ARP9_9PSEU|nr:carbamoyltransferase HypF [Crossiella equi]MBP2478375.1 hydrogenase maturation protein HypF [Crossiella equi]
MSTPPITVAAFHLDDNGDAPSRSVAGDLAPCAECVRELFDPADRRHRYPFLCCTACGPRASVTERAPGHRQDTGYARLLLCQECAAEFTDQTGRRYRCPALGCWTCGPRVRWLAPGAGRVLGRIAVASAVETLRAGGVVAVKGVGGYQLLCRADDEQAVRTLRARKARPAKAFPVLVPDLATARRTAVVPQEAALLLYSPRRPAVLLRRCADTELAPSVAPDLSEIALALPHSPLQHLLLNDLGVPLVSTSGRRDGQGIITDDNTAVKHLGPIVDGLLTHDLPIALPQDESLARIVRRRPVLLRRGRGYTPGTLPLPFPAPEPLLALGARADHTVCLAMEDHAVLGPHHGALETSPPHPTLVRAADALCRQFTVRPKVLVHDLHPQHPSTRHALRWPGATRIAVQHHHAHVVATAAEHRVPAPFLGLAYDEIGLGDDQTLWGGEVLLCDYTSYRRLGRFGHAPLPGGSSAVRYPAQMALGYLVGSEQLGSARPPAPLTKPFLDRLPEGRLAAVRRLVRESPGPKTSSVARLFDAVASLLGLHEDNTYSGEALARMEHAAAPYGRQPSLPWRLVRRGGLHVVDPVPTLRAVLSYARQCPPGEVAARFHTTIVEASLAMLEDCARRTGVWRICLGGSVFQNRLLTTALLDQLAEHGYQAHVGSAVPVNDGGIAYGQAVIAAARLGSG